MLMGPAGFAAVIAGWITAEVGRQPWVVYGLMRTSQAVSPVTAHEVSASLIGFLVVYALIFTAGVLYILRLIVAGPASAAADPPAPGPGAPGSALAAAPPEPRGMSLDLPLIWAGVIALAVVPLCLAGRLRSRDRHPVPVRPQPGRPRRHDGHHRPLLGWQRDLLVLGGGGLFAAFPGAYAALLPAFYLPIFLMLLALILRGVAFEFRARGRRRGKRLWTILFCAGSVLAAVAQGLVLGGFVHGVSLKNGLFVGGAFDWASPYAALTALGLVAGYALLGAGWLMIKTRDELHGDARRWARAAPRW